MIRTQHPASPSSASCAPTACADAAARRHDGTDFAFAGACISREAFIWAQAKVIKAACLIEPSVDAVLDWFAGDPIDALGGRTAESLVSAGMAHDVLGFLASVAQDADTAAQVRRLRADALA